MSLILILALAVIVAYLVHTKWRVYLVGARLPGPWALPLVGNVQMITKLRPESLFLSFGENRAKYRASYRLWLGPQLWVFLHSPAETREALNNPTLKRPAIFQQLHVLIGSGLLISQGKVWETHRRALAPAFHPNVLNSFAPTISEHADQLVLKLRQADGKVVEVSDCLFACILDAIIETSMGKKLNSLGDSHSQHTRAFHKASELLFKRMINPLLGCDFIFERTKMGHELNESLRVIHGLMEAVIYERAAALKQQFSNAGSQPTMGEDVVGATGKRRRTLLDTLLTAEIDGQALSRQEIRDEVNTFVFAGVDTTTAAMCFVLYCLGKYPVEQRRLYAEITDIQNTDGAGAGQQSLTITEINRLQYLDMFIKEVMRYYTTVPLTGRETTTDTTIGGRRYCAGITLWIDLYGLAHDERYFEAPHEFRPERFGREQQQQLPPYCYLPFSGGPHVCIGRKYALLIMKIVTVKILQNFEVRLGDGQEELVLMAQMVLKSLHGINLIFAPRTEEKYK